MSLGDAHLLLEVQDRHLVQEWDQQVEQEEECLRAVSLDINFKTCTYMVKLETAYAVLKWTVFLYENIHMHLGFIMEGFLV